MLDISFRLLVGFFLSVDDSGNGVRGQEIYREGIKGPDEYGFNPQISQITRIALITLRTMRNP